MQRELPQWVGRRGVRRHTVIWPAIVSGDRHGAVLNISEGGACLKLDGAAPTPEHMELEIAGVGQLPARRAWALHGRVGVAFLMPPEWVRPLLDRALAGPRGAGAASVA